MFVVFGWQSVEQSGLSMHAVDTSAEHNASAIPLGRVEIMTRPFCAGPRARLTAVSIDNRRERTMRATLVPRARIATRARNTRVVRARDISGFATPQLG
jgi:hypothetical protein